MTPLLAPPCGAPNPALCLRVSNTEQATLLLVCRARREGPERCGRSDVPAPRPGQRDHGPPHVPRVPERAAHPRPQLRASSQALSVFRDSARNHVRGQQSLLWTARAETPWGGGLRPRRRVAVPALARGLGGGPRSLPPTPLRPSGRWGRGGEAPPPFLLGPAPGARSLFSCRIKLS